MLISESITFFNISFIVYTYHSICPFLCGNNGLEYAGLNPYSAANTLNQYQKITLINLEEFYAYFVEGYVWNVMAY